MAYYILGQQIEISNRQANMGFLYNMDDTILTEMEPMFNEEYFSLAQNAEIFGENIGNLICKYQDKIIEVYASFIKAKKIYTYGPSDYKKNINIKYIERHIEDIYKKLYSIEKDPEISSGLFANGRIKKMQSEYLKNDNTYGEMLDCLIEISENSRDFTADVLEKEANIICARISKENHNKAVAILENSRGMSLSDKSYAYVQALGYDCLFDDIYDSIIRDFPSELDNVNKIKRALFLKEYRIKG